MAELEETRVEEHKMAYFSCEVNKENVSVKWYKNGRLIAPSDKHQLLDEGRKHTLIINDAEKTDATEYSVVVGDKKSSAKLYLDGTCIRLLLILLVFLTGILTAWCVYWTLNLD